MHFTTPALVAIFSATLAAASPTPILGSLLDWKSDWDNKWKNDDWKKHEKVFYFDKTYHVKATPDQVIAQNGQPAPGQPGAKGIFKFGINVAENTICYNITLSGVTGEYSSMANTATHIHEAPKGSAGPPRLAFPNPIGPVERRVSYGCLTGPFLTGIKANGVDTGVGFHVKQIVANPSGFFADTHTKEFLSGAVRGQLGH